MSNNIRDRRINKRLEKSRLKENEVLKQAASNLLASKYSGYMKIIVNQRNLSYMVSIFLLIGNLVQLYLRFFK